MIGPEHAINLSYVLHEPSGSRVVSAAMRHASTRARELRREMSRFASLDRESLRERVVIHPALHSSISQHGAPQVVYQACIGVWQLTPTLIDLCLSSVTTPIVQIDSPGNASPSTQRELFRAAAKLATRGERLAAGAVIGFIAPVVRPGNQSIMLCGKVLEPLREPLGEQDIPYAILRLAEDHIRAYVDQWTPPVALWTTPAESTLPEFAQPAPQQGR
jgi:hypothetical protein